MNMSIEILEQGSKVYVKVTLLLAMFILFFIVFNWLMGYRKNHITIDLDGRYMDHIRYVKAIQCELAKQGREICYKENGKFIVDGRSFTLYVILAVAIIFPPLKSFSSSIEWWVVITSSMSYNLIVIKLI